MAPNCFAKIIIVVTQISNIPLIFYWLEKLLLPPQTNTIG